MEKIVRPLANNHISVDCVVIGYDEGKLKVLLVKRKMEELHDMKLPGSLIYQDEDLDEAASRVLNELCGLKKKTLIQFKAFGSKHRTDDKRDIIWLERAMQERVERIVTVVYFSLAHSLYKIAPAYEAEWVTLDEVKELPFDHNLIIKETLDYIRDYAVISPQILFNMLPRKFTAFQLRQLFELLFNKPIDVRNFHKKIVQMKYVVPLDDFEKDVSHRAARYYKFDKKIYNKVYRTTQSFNKKNK